MSDEIEIVIDSNQTIVESELIIDVVNNNNIVDIESSEPDVVVTFKKQEYVITGDDMYIPLSYDEAPQWLKDTITNITDFSLNQKLTEIGALSNTLYGLIDELNVAKNTYTMSIINSAEIDERINARIETLNSSLSGSDATIVDLIATKATPTEASSLALNVLTASINDGAISSLVSNLQNAISTTNSTLSNNIDIVHSEMTGDFEATSEAIDAIETSVTSINGILTSHAGQITNLQASASTVDGKIATANSSVINTVNTTIANGDAVVTSKWAYNSTLNIGGTNYNSGFGLSNSAGTGVGSEFWIDASKLKFTNSAKTGRVAPFTIDASTATPQIYFNGKVSFSNVNGANMSGSNLLYNSAPAIGMETKGWQADHNTTGIASNGILASGDPYRPAGGGAFYQNIPGTPAVGKVFDMRSTGAVPVIGGQFYEGSAYLNSHRCDSQIYVGWRDSAGSTITWSMGSVVTQTNTTNVLSAWGRSKFIAQAPANAVSCYYYIRGTSTGQANPYVFVSMCYFGIASEGQSVFSSWSEGISASISSSDVSAIANSAVNNIAWQSEVQTAINNNATTIDGAKITTGQILAARINTVGLIADSVRTHNLTAWNTTIENGLITNAKISDGAITNAKIGDASIDAAKIIDGNITNAKIGYASVDTLKIQGEAIVVPRFAEAIGSNRATIYYTPTVTHTVLLICNVQWSTGGEYYVIGVNGAVHKNGRMGSYGSSSFTKAFSISTLVTLSAGVAYSLTFQLSQNGAYYNTALSEWTQITMMGAKR